MRDFSRLSADNSRASSAGEPGNANRSNGRCATTSSRLSCSGSSTCSPPFTTRRARDRILQYIETGKTEARLAFGAAVPAASTEGPADRHPDTPVGESAPERVDEPATEQAGERAHEQAGFYVGPHIFAEVQPEAVIAQEEIFGPVLAVTKAANFDEALELAACVRYGLTGGLFSRDPGHIKRAYSEFRVGNLYINRQITGAIVGRQPFGGSRMSGVGSKAGGPDYLLQFLEPRTVTENTLRRGFAPPEGFDSP